MSTKKPKKKTRNTKKTLAVQIQTIFKFWYTLEIDWDAAQAEANAAQQNRQFHRRHLYDQDKSVEELAREIEERHKNYVLEGANVISVIAINHDL